MTEVPSQQVPDCGSIEAAFGQAPVCSAGCELVFEASCVQPGPKAAHHRRTGDVLQGASSIGQMNMLVRVRIMRALAEPESRLAESGQHSARAQHKICRLLERQGPRAPSGPSSAGQMVGYDILGTI